MNAEEQLNLSLNVPDFLCLSGSLLYGTNTENSDEDIRGFTLPPFEYLIGVKNFDCKDFPNEDKKIYSAKRFIDLILQGDPQCTELLFAPEEKVYLRSEFANKIFEIKEHLISRNIFHRIMGYSNNEWRKAMAIRIVPEKRPKKEIDVLSELWNFFPNLSKNEKDGVLETLYGSREKKIVSSVSGIGEKRKEQVEKFGYCPKGASHAIRLVEQLSELLIDGVMTFPRPNADLLKDIKKGRINKDELNKIYEDKKTQAEKDFKLSDLREKPNYNLVWEEYTKIIVDYLKLDNRFMKF